MNKNQGQEYLEQIISFLEKEGFIVAKIESKIACVFTYHILKDVIYEDDPNEEVYKVIKNYYQCQLIIDEDRSSLIFFITASFCPNEEFLVPLAELIARINYGEDNHALGLDFLNRTIRCKKVVQWQEVKIPLTEIKSILDDTVNVWENTYKHLIEAIIYNNKSPKEVMELIQIQPK
jgi:hypothetical protein